MCDERRASEKLLNRSRRPFVSPLLSLQPHPTPFWGESSDTSGFFVWFTEYLYARSDVSKLPPFYGRVAEPGLCDISHSYDQNFVVYGDDLGELCDFDFAVPTYVDPQDTLLRNPFTADNTPTHAPLLRFPFGSTSQSEPDGLGLLSADTSRPLEVGNDSNLAYQPTSTYSSCTLLEQDYVVGQSDFDGLQPFASEAFASVNPCFSMSEDPSFASDHSEEDRVTFGGIGAPGHSTVLHPPVVLGPEQSLENAEDTAFTSSPLKGGTRSLKRKRDEKFSPHVDDQREEFVTPREIHVCEWEKCDRVYRDVSELRTHLRIHTLSATSCKWQGCQRPAEPRSTLNKHLDRHIRPCICTEDGCAHACATARDLHRHIATHRPSYGYHCPIHDCEYSSNGKKHPFSRLDNAVRHIKTKHMGSSANPVAATTRSSPI